MPSSRSRVAGQSTAEYILIVVLVAVLSIGVITVFGNQVRDLYRVAIEGLGGVEDPKLDGGITDSAEGEVNQGLPDLKRSH